MANKVTIDKFKLKRSDILDKVPTPEQLEYGELAINYNKDKPFLSFKNSYGEVKKFEMANSEDPKKIYVVKSSTKSTQNGTIEYPFKTIQSAINAAPSGAIIEIDSDSYTENIVIAGKSYLSIKGQGNLGQPRTIINGHIDINGTNDSLGLSNLNINGAVLKSGDGTLYPDNCSFIECYIDGGASGYCRFDFCSFKENFINNADVLTDLFNCQFENNAVVYSAGTVGNWTTKRVYLQDCLNVCIRSHIRGTIVSAGSTNFIITSTDQYCINSTALDADGRLYLLEGTTFNGESYFPINKTGDCTYSIGAAFQYEPSISTFTGIRKDSGAHSDQVYDHNTRTGYTKINDTIKGHLDGISNALNSSTPTTHNGLNGRDASDAHPATSITDLGDPSTLQTTNKTIVGAINEVKNSGGSGPKDKIISTDEKTSFTANDTNLTGVVSEQEVIKIGKELRGPVGSQLNYDIVTIKDTVGNPIITSEHSDESITGDKLVIYCGGLSAFLYKPVGPDRIFQLGNSEMPIVDGEGYRLLTQADVYDTPVEADSHVLSTGGAYVLQQQIEALKTNAYNITLLSTNWDGSNNYVYTLSTQWSVGKEVDFGLPVPTTRVNCTNVSDAELIVTNITETEITFNAKTVPTTDLQITLRY